MAVVKLLLSLVLAAVANQLQQLIVAVTAAKNVKNCSAECVDVEAVAKQIVAATKVSRTKLIDLGILPKPFEIKNAIRHRMAFFFHVSS